MEKKNEVITFRTDSETKENLNQIAIEKEWSVAQVVNKICKEHFTSKTKYNIQINTEIGQDIEDALKERKWSLGDLIDIFVKSLTPDMIEEIASAFDMCVDEVQITLDTRLEDE